MGDNRSWYVFWFRCNVKASTQFLTTHFFSVPVPFSVLASVNTYLVYKSHLNFIPKYFPVKKENVRTISNKIFKITVITGKGHIFIHEHVMPVSQIPYHLCINMYDPTRIKNCDKSSTNRKQVHWAHVSDSLP